MRKVLPWITTVARITPLAPRPSSASWKMPIAEATMSIYGVHVEEDIADFLLEGARGSPGDRPRQEHFSPAAPNVEEARARAQLEHAQQPRS